MEYKLIAVDMDGTLLNSKHEISEKTIEAVKKATEKGVVFSLCSGRPIQGVIRFNEQLGLDCPFTTYNGAMVILGKSGEILYEQGLSEDDARDVLAITKKYDVTGVAWSKNRPFTFEITDVVQNYLKASKAEPHVITDEEALIREGITKIIWLGDPERLIELQKVIGRHLSDSVNFYTSQAHILEFIDQKVSKATAMEKIGEYCGIRREEMIAIGDGYNDLPMIAYAGLGVAMGNAPDDIKEKADFVTLSNDEDGIAHIIEKFVL